jgi:putative adenylate-forming enzyme
VNGPRRSRILGAYLRTRIAAATLTRRAALEAHQQWLWRRLAPALAATPALRALAGRPLDAFPVVTPAEIRADVAEWNGLGLTADAARAAAEAAEAGRDGGLPGGVQAGFSTGGGGGTRGLFITTPAERDDYLGTLLGKLIGPTRLLRPLRAALILRANNRLYQDIQGAGAAFAFIGLDVGPDAQLAALEAFAPTHLVAPPHVLAALAARIEAGGWRPRLDSLFYGAEPIGVLEQAWLAEVFGLAPRPLYQATEGFLGAPCRHGTLHLNEDGLIVELEPVVGTDRFTPIVTDLRRRGQPMVRIRLDDLIEPLDGPCACGSPRLSIRPIEGRLGDVWRFGEVAIPPREIDARIEGALGPRAVWTARARPGAARIEVAAPADPEPARAAVEALLRERGVAVPVTASTGPGREPGPKRRRVRWSS